MADNAKGKIAANILLDDIKSRITGTLNFDITSALTASAGQGWIYTEKLVSASANADLIEVTDDYVGSDFDGVVAVGDKILWLCIQHSGTSNGSTNTTEGIILTLDANASNAHDDADGIFIDSGETMILKAPNCTVAGLHARTVTVGNGIPTGNGTSTVKVKITGILRNVG